MGYLRREVAAAREDCDKVKQAHDALKALYEETQAETERRLESFSLSQVRLAGRVDDNDEHASSAIQETKAKADREFFELEEKLKHM